MSGSALFMVIASAFMHAGWNLIVRRQRADAASHMLQMLGIIAVAGLVPMAATEILLGTLGLKVWLCAVTSGLFCAVYCVALTRGYGSADFTVVYPVVRALPVLMVGLGDVALGRFPTAMGWMGMSLVTLGCFLAPLHSLGAFHPGVYFHRSGLWMLLAAGGTLGYTLVDKTAAGLVTPGPGSAARYAYLFFAFTWLFFAAFLRLTRRGDAAPARLDWRLAVVGAAMIGGGYWPVLWAYQLVLRASYVVACRQFSIVVGVVLAFLIYRETGKFVRITASVLITLGLVVITLWGK